MERSLTPKKLKFNGFLTPRSKGGKSHGMLPLDNRINQPFKKTSIVFRSGSDSPRDSPRGNSTASICRKCLDYLRKEEAWKVEGIFRKCGKFEEINNSLQTMLEGNNREILSSLGVIGTADLLKLVLRNRDPLLTHCETYLKSIPTLVIDNELPAGIKEELPEEFLKASIAMLEKEDRGIFKELCSFFQEMAKHQDGNKLSLSSISSLFSPIVFTSPRTTDPMIFLKESKKLSSLLEYTLTKIFECPNFFRLLRSQRDPQRRYASRSHKKSMMKGAQIIRGEELVAFHWNLNKAYCLFKGKVHCVEQDVLEELFILYKPGEKSYSYKAMAYRRIHRSTQSVMDRSFNKLTFKDRSSDKLAISNSPSSHQLQLPPEKTNTGNSIPSSFSSGNIAHFATPIKRDRSGTML